MMVIYFLLALLFISLFVGFKSESIQKIEALKQVTNKQQIITIQPIKKLETLVANSNRQQEGEMPERVPFSGIYVVSMSGTSSVAGVSSVASIGYIPPYLENVDNISYLNFLPSDNIWGNYAQYEIKNNLPSQDIEVVEKNKYRTKIVDLLTARAITLKHFEKIRG